MKRLRFYYLCAAVLLIGGSAAGNEVRREYPWSLDECIAFALGNQADVLSAANNVRIAESRSAKANSGYFPQASLKYNAFSWGSDGVLVRTTTGTAISVTQNVFDGGLREAGAQAARYGFAQSVQSLRRVRQMVTFEVTRAYYEVLRARHLAEVARANVTYNEELRNRVQALAEEGEAAAVDVLPVEAQLANARVALLSANNTLRTSLIGLQNSMGMAPAAGFDVAEAPQIAMSKPDALNQYVTRALANRPDLAGTAAALQAASAAVKSARISLYPRPVITAEYQKRVSGGFSDSGTEMVGGIAWDIFDGAANRAAYREAEAARENAAIQQSQTERDVRAEVEAAYLNLTSAAERVEASRVSLEAARANHEAQKGRYETGVGILLDVLNSEVQLVTAQTSEVEARYDYYIAAAQLDLATGNLGDNK